MTLSIHPFTNPTLNFSSYISHPHSFVHELDSSRGDPCLSNFFYTSPLAEFSDWTHKWKCLAPIPSHSIPSHPILSHFIPSHSIRSYSIKLPKLIMCYIFGVLLPYSNIFRYVCKCESCVSCESSESSVSSVSSVNSLCGGVRDVPLYRLCIFFTLFKRPSAPTPLRFEEFC